MTREIGSRVGTISHTEGDTVYVFGYGVYEGDHVPTADNRPAGSMGDAMFSEQISNPRIRLDDGKVVWGCECWWGPKEAVKKRIEKYETMQKVDIEARRKEVRAPKEGT